MITIVLPEEEYDALDEILREGWNGGEFAKAIMARYRLREARKRVAASERALLTIHTARRAADRIKKVAT